MATTWFGDDERALATSLGSLSMPMGCITGLVIPSFFITRSDLESHCPGHSGDNDDKLCPEAISAGKSDMTTMMLVQAFLISFLCFWSFFYRESPPHFPSKSAMTSNAESFSFKNDFVALMKNKNYIFMVISFNMLYGIYTCLGAIINNIVYPFDYTSGHSSIFGAVFILSGLAGSMVVSGFLDKTKKYLFSLRFTVAGSITSAIGLYFSMPYCSPA